MISIVRPGTWPSPSTLLGTADSWETAAKAREFIEQTGRQPSLPGYVPEGGSKRVSDEERKAA